MFTQNSDRNWNDFRSHFIGECEFVLSSVAAVGVGDAQFGRAVSGLYVCVGFTQRCSILLPLSNWLRCACRNRFWFIYFIYFKVYCQIIIKPG